MFYDKNHPDVQIKNKTFGPVDQRNFGLLYQSIHSATHVDQSARLDREPLAEETRRCEPRQSTTQDAVAHVCHRSQSNTAIVICSAFGHEALFSYRAHRHLALNLASAGFPTLTFDYLGSGESDLDSEQGLDIESMVAQVERACAYLCSEIGAQKIVLYGLRFGGLIATHAATRIPNVDGLLLFAPVIYGRHYARELQLAQSSISGFFPPKCESKPYEEVWGYPLPIPFQNQLKKLSALQERAQSLKWAFIATRDDIDNKEVDLVKSFESLGIQTEIFASESYSKLMASQEFRAVTPKDLWSVILERLQKNSKDPEPREQLPSIQSKPAKVDSTFDGLQSTQCSTASRAESEFVDFHGMRGFVTFARADTGQISSKKQFGIFINVGANRRTGAHRIYVFLARALASKGISTLRYDGLGIGDSDSTQDNLEMEVYRESAINEVRTSIDLVLSKFPDAEITLLGICSGAFYSLHTAFSDARVRSIVLINPADLAWKKGDSIEIPRNQVFRSEDYYKRSAVSLNTWKRLVKFEIDLFGITRAIAVRLIWQAKFQTRWFLHSIGISSFSPNTVAEKISAILNRGAFISMIFSEDDYGLVNLSKQTGKNASLFAKRSNFKLCKLSYADHTITPLVKQTELLEQVLEHFDSENRWSQSNSKSGTSSPTQLRNT